MEPEKERDDLLPLMSNIEFAHLGGGEVAYVKELTSDEAEELFPSIDDLPKGVNLFSLHAADGTPLALAESRSAAIANALEHDLETVSLH